jgi:hypothetical protein
MPVASKLAVDNGAGDADKLQLDKRADIFFGKVIVDSIIILKHHPPIYSK